MIKLAISERERSGRWWELWEWCMVQFCGYLQSFVDTTWFRDVL